MSIYQSKKGFSQPKPEKTKRQKFLTGERVKQLLDTIVTDSTRFMRRDHCAVFLGYHFGLRISETAMLERNTFRDIIDAVAHIRTLKQGERIQYTCQSCSRRSRVAIDRAGKEWRCRCGVAGIVPASAAKNKSTLPPEKEPPVVERHVVEYLARYIKNVMLPDQRWLFETRPGKHIAAETLRKIFAHYIMKTGLDPMYSWHALRHGRGVALWERFQDGVLVRDMLRQRSIASTEQYLHLSPRRSSELQTALEQDADATNMAANPFGDK